MYHARLWILAPGCFASDPVDWKDFMDYPVPILMDCVKG